MMINKKAILPLIVLAALMAVWILPLNDETSTTAKKSFKILT
jgi:hypothetical protein